jgi:hypothetical protein
VACRRARELVSSLQADLGGSDHLSEGTRQLVRRAAVLGVFIENSEAAWLAGHEVALGDYLSAVNSQRRVLTTIGLERRQRDVTTPTLEEIADEIAAEEEAAAQRDTEREAAGT